MSSKGRLSDGVLAVHSSRPRKRSANTMAPQGASQNGQTQAFFFVDPASSTREKRAHVMRHHIQAKRKQTMQATHTDRQSRREPRVYPWTKKPGGNEAEPNARPIHSAIPAATPTYPVSPTYFDLGNANRDMNQFSDHIIAVTDARKDSSSTSAYEETYDDNTPWGEEQLIDMWNSQMTYWSGQNAHMKEKIYYAALTHRVSFEGIILGYCSRWEFHLNNRTDDSVWRNYEFRVRQAIMNKTDEHGPLEDDTITLALGGLALQETRFGDKNKAREYVGQARDIQLHKKTKPTNRLCQPLLFFLLTIMDPQDIAIHLTEANVLLVFLRRARECMEKDSDDQYLMTVPQRSASFQFDCPLFQLLSSGPRPSQVPVDRRFFVVNKNVPTTEWARTAALIYIILALCDFCGDQVKTSRFLAELQQLLIRYGLDRNPACESLLFFLLEDTWSEDLKNPKRGWQTSQVVEIHKRLPFELQFRFNEMLLGYLMLIPPITSVEAFERDLYGIAHP